MLNRDVASWKANSLPIVAGIALFASMILITQVPESYRLWNFTLFGAVGIYLAARGGRYGLPLAIGLVLSAKFVGDSVNGIGFGRAIDWPTIVVAYASLALYAVIGLAMLRKRVTVTRIVGTAFLASLQFFLLTNFVSWRMMALPYEQSVAGLVESYSMAIPFYRGTLLSDLTFTPLLFGLEYAVMLAPWAVLRRAEQPIQ